MKCFAVVIALVFFSYADSISAPPTSFQMIQQASDSLYFTWSSSENGTITNNVTNPVMFSFEWFTTGKTDYTVKITALRSELLSPNLFIKNTNYTFRVRVFFSANGMSPFATQQFFTGPNWKHGSSAVAMSTSVFTILLVAIIGLFTL